MDLNVREELHATIEKLTHSGAPSLDSALVKKVKDICRQGDATVRATYEVLMHDLVKNHAEIRLSTFQLIGHIFTRSYLFRELLILDFKKFASLVTGTDPKLPLPPPKDVAARLKKSSLLAIRDWNQKYGSSYPKLKLGFNYLKFNKKVDFDQLVSQNEAERRRREEREARQRTILQQRIHEIKQEMVDLRSDIDGCLVEVESCFNLLLPRFELPDIYSSNEDAAGRVSQDTRDSQDTRNCQVTGRRHPRCSEPVTQRLSSHGSFLSPSEGGSDCEEEEDVGGELDKQVVDKHCLFTGEKEVVREKEDAGASLASEEAGEACGSDDPLPTCGTDDDAALPKAHCGVDSLPSDDMDSDSGTDSDSDVEWEDVPAAAHSGTELWNADMQEHGMAAHSFSVPVQLSNRVEVIETDDNSSILSTLRERRLQLVNHHLPNLSKCLEWMSKAGEGDSVRAAIDLKDKINTTLAKYSRLNIIFRDPDAEETPAMEESHQQDSNALAAKTETETEWKFGTDVPESITVADLELDPTTPQAQLAVLKKKLAKKPLPAQSHSEEAQSSKSMLKGKAPVIPFGMDLYHWENASSSVEPRTLVPVGSLHRFWAQETEISISKDEQDRLKCRTISFPGQFEPVMRSCRALLPSGKLCPRKDRHKCPFHGVIVPRDEAGNPVGDVAQELGQPLLPGADDAPPLWQDQMLQQEIMAAKGVELQASRGRKGKGKGKRTFKAKFPGLTDLKAQVDTPRKRVERKVLSKKSLKRVAESINQLTTKKYNDKFGNNFNYALKN